jgi:hypothetical protein
MCTFVSRYLWTRKWVIRVPFSRAHNEKWSDTGRRPWPVRQEKKKKTHRTKLHKKILSNDKLESICWVCFLQTPFSRLLDLRKPVCKSCVYPRSCSWGPSVLKEQRQKERYIHGGKNWQNMFAKLLAMGRKNGVEASSRGFPVAFPLLLTLFILRCAI